MYSVLNAKATLKSVEGEFEGDVKGIIPTDQPYPFIYDASMGTECEKPPRVGVLVLEIGRTPTLGSFSHSVPMDASYMNG